MPRPGEFLPKTYDSEIGGSVPELPKATRGGYFNETETGVQRPHVVATLVKALSTARPEMWASSRILIRA